MKAIICAAMVTGAAMFSGAPANANPIDYSTPGLVNSASYTFEATSSGDILGYFFGSSADDASTVGMSVNGSGVGSYGLNNHSSSVGQVFDFGYANAGDVLTFFLSNLTSNTILSSEAALNGDFKQHVYSTAYSSSGASVIPDGLLLSFEDLLGSQGSDFDYNDDSFVLTNVTDPPGVAPLPSSLGLFAFGLGIIGLAFRFVPKANKRRMRPSGFRDPNTNFYGI